MIRTTTLFARSIAFVSVFGLVNLSVPMGALAVMGPSAREAITPKLPPKSKPMPVSRPLSGKRLRQLQGKAGQNPYLAGQNKWDVIYKGVNLMTGNYSTSVTDMSFEGGYGIPVNVTRSYSSNNIDEGPFGIGWNLSADVRSTAGGLLKSASAPVRSVPVGFKERATGEVDPNAVAADGAVGVQPIEAVIATDAGGKEETIQRDVDGILTTPPWDANINENTRYEEVTKNGLVYRLLVHNETRTPDGSLYVYDKYGTYDTRSGNVSTAGGTRPWGVGTGTQEPANVMKITSATDRQGNTTTYTYAGPSVTFTKANGTTTETGLSLVTMPNGHTISFVWSNFAQVNQPPIYRVWKVKDNNDARVITYGYTSGSLTSVNVKSNVVQNGYTTLYGYGTSGASAGLLTSATDPRGLTTQISYGAFYGYVPTALGVVPGPVVGQITAPSGSYTLFDYRAYQSGGSVQFSNTGVFGELGIVYPWHAGYEEHAAVDGALLFRAYVGATAWDTWVRVRTYYPCNPNLSLVGHWANLATGLPLSESIHGYSSERTYSLTNQTMSEETTVRKATPTSMLARYLEVMPFSLPLSSVRTQTNYKFCRKSFIEGRDGDRVSSSRCSGFRFSGGPQSRQCALRLLGQG